MAKKAESAQKQHEMALETLTKVEESRESARALTGSTWLNEAAQARHFFRGACGLYWISG